MSDDQTESLAITLVDTIACPETIEILSESGEILIDSIMEDGALKDVPIFGSLYKLYSIGVTVKDALFVKKLQLFLRSLDTVPYKNRQQFLINLNSDPSFRQRVGENLLLLIEQADDIQKPKLIAKAFKAYIEKRITYEEFSKIGSAINRVYLSDLIQLSQTGSVEEGAGLASLGILSPSVLMVPGTAPVTYSLSGFGKLLISICFS